MYKPMLFAIGAIVLCCQFSSQRSTTAKEKPTINFSGELIDTSGRSAKIENITIHNRIDGIQLYSIPPKGADGKYASPDDNTLLLDLRKVRKIEAATSGSSPSAMTINNREYVPIHITFIDGSTQDYIVEKRRKVIADDLSSGGSERNISFSAIKELVITGSKSQDPVQVCQDLKIQSKSMAFMMHTLSTVKESVNSFLGKIWYT